MYTDWRLETTELRAFDREGALLGEKGSLRGISTEWDVIASGHVCGYACDLMCICFMYLAIISLDVQTRPVFNACEGWDVRHFDETTKAERARPASPSTSRLPPSCPDLPCRLRL